jgi:hypothetical protein
MARFGLLWLSLTAAASHGLAAALAGRSFDIDFQSYEARDAEWPYGPVRIDGRDILNARGDKIKWAGANWPMSGKLLPSLPSVIHD